MLSAIRRGFFAGSGSAALSEFSVCDYILDMTGKFSKSTTTLHEPVRVVYLGTATYDLQGPREKQTHCFQSRGCDVVSLNVADYKASPSHSVLVDAFANADIVIVSGGNTLFALRRWQEVGVDALIRTAAARGAVMTGGSAGAICWFDGGHSDSMDPESYREAMLTAAGVLPAATTSAEAPEHIDEASTAVPVGAAPKSWTYIRVSGLGLLPGLMCPHHDRTQSNGKPRYEDFDRMLLRHRGERGIVIDHWAALVVNEGSYHVFSTPGKEGSCVIASTSEESSDATPQHEFVTDGSGIPAVWWKEVVSSDLSGSDAAVVRHAVPFTGGALDTLLRVADSIELDPLESVCAVENPTQY